MINHDELVDITNKSVNGFEVIRIKSGKFEGIEYIYGEVSFDVKDEQLVFHYEYELVSGVPSDEKEFRNLTGDILISILDRQLEKNEVVYHNGIDE